MSEEGRQPIARVKLVRADNAKTNGITIEIEGKPADLAALVGQAFEQFEAAIERMRPSDPQGAAK